jgi:hypothetical protein
MSDPSLLTGSRHTYFYVFVDSESDDDKADVRDTAEVSPDRAVQQVFNRRLKKQHQGEFMKTQPAGQKDSDMLVGWKSKQITVFINAPDALRRVLGIRSLPAFAISDFELPLDGSLRDAPQNLPSRWNLLKLSERNRILESGKRVPTVERPVISLYNTSDKLYQFVRDLHTKNIDSGIVGVGLKIEGVVRKMGNKVILEEIASAKKVIW